MTPVFEKLTTALGNMLALIEKNVDQELSPQEERLLDEAADLYAEMTTMRKNVRRVS